MAQLNRRRFMQSTAATVGAATYFTDVSALYGYAINPTMRRNASNMATNDPVMIGYRRAVAAMKNLPDSNPCSWFYQSAIHGTNVMPAQTAWNSCHMDARFFWAWHRMYLYWFERIIRKYSGMFDWALPYWNWTSTNAAQRAIPAPFRVTNSTLYDASRNASLNTGATSLSTSLGTSVANFINNQNNYFSAQGSANGPHGGVHVAIGGNMGSVNSAAKDPLFWLHHSEVDRQWNVWLGQGGRSNPVSDASWRNESFTFFDECCEEVTMTPCQILRAARQLGYEYEDEPTQVNQYCPLTPIIVGPLIPIKWYPILKGRLRDPYLIRNDIVRHNLGNLEPENLKMIEGFRDKAKEKRRGETDDDLVLRLQGIEAETQTGAAYEVYLGPKGMESFNSDSRYFVGVFGMFSAGLKSRQHHYRPAEYVFSINERLAKGLRRDEYEVVIVPISGLDDEKIRPKSEYPLSIQSISVEGIEATPVPNKDEQEKLRSQAESE